MIILHFVVYFSFWVGKMPFMKDSAISLSSEGQESLSLFNCVLPWKVKLQEIIKLLGSTEGEDCLEIGAHNGGISYYLRKRGGTWHSVVTSSHARDSVTKVVGDNVHLMESGILPFKKHTFDVVVVVDFLEITDADSVFIEECHRVLKPDGRLLINVARSTPWSLINPLRRMLGREMGKQPDLYLGYNEPELFTLLKHGFDVHTVRKYSRFLVELVNTIVRLIVVRIGKNGEGDAGIRKVYSTARFFYWLAYQLDLLMFLCKGHHLLASAQRRAWRARNAPVLIDGRKISEAVLSPLK
jgi:SAM-dependent methyltransferase